MKKIFCFLFLYIITNLAAIAQQDPQFSFNKLTQLSVNPGCAGNEGEVNGLMLNRWQWMGFKGAPETLLFSVSTETDMLGFQSGVGLNIISETLGNQKNFSANADYAFRKKTKFGNLGVGVSLGVYNIGFSDDWYVPEGSNWVEFDSDDGMPHSEISRTAFDLGLGFNLKSNDYYLGASVTHLNQASIIFDGIAETYLAKHYYLAGGYSIKMSDPLFEIQPSVLFKTDMVAYQTDIAVDLVYNKRMSGGLNYRINDAISVLLGFELANGLRIGFAYDISTSAMASYNDGSFEGFLGYSFDLGKNRSKKYKSVRFL